MGLASKNVATFVLVVMVILCITSTVVIGHRDEVYIGPCNDSSDCAQNCHSQSMDYAYCIPPPTARCVCFRR